MKLRKGLILFLLIVVSLSLVVGCTEDETKQQQDDATTPDPTQEQQILIKVNTSETVNSYFQQHGIEKFMVVMDAETEGIKTQTKNIDFKQSQNQFQVGFSDLPADIWSIKLEAENSKGNLVLAQSKPLSIEADDNFTTSFAAQLK